MRPAQYSARLLKTALKPFKIEMIADKGINESDRLFLHFGRDGRVRPLFGGVCLHFAKHVKSIAIEKESGAGGSAGGAEGCAFDKKYMHGVELFQRAAAPGAGGQNRGIALIGSRKRKSTGTMPDTVSAFSRRPSKSRVRVKASGVPSGGTPKASTKRIQFTAAP